MADKYLSVAALNKYLYYKFDNDLNLRDIYLKAEISNVRLSKGILYFILKDNEVKFYNTDIEINTNEKMKTKNDIITHIIQNNTRNYVEYDKENIFKILYNFRNEDDYIENILSDFFDKYAL